jgi:hypothetical protein
VFDGDFGHASAIADQAERELAVYLRVVHECLGCRDPLLSGHVWIEALESLEWPTREHESFPTSNNPGDLSAHRALGG